jgi:TATA-box binding protein (TBP) (component of TFIID and TFIIIB)
LYIVIIKQLTSLPEADEADVKIVNIIVKSHIRKPFSLSHLTSKFPFDENLALSRIAIPYKHVHFLIFRTGYVTLTGFNAIEDLQMCTAELQSLIAEIVLKHPDVLEGIEHDRSTLHTEKGRVMARV